MKKHCQIIILLRNRNTCVFTGKDVWENVNPGIGSIPFKSIVIFKQTQRSVELSNRTGPRSRPESAGPNGTVRSYLYLVNRTPTDYPTYGGGNGPREG